MYFGFVLVPSSLEVDASDIQKSGSDMKLVLGGLERCWIGQGPSDNCRGFRSASSESER